MSLLVLLDPRVSGVVVRARQRLGWNQQKLGEALGGSKRTAARWEAGQASIGAQRVCDLARIVYATDASIAAELAAAAGQSLESLGLRPAPVAAPPPPPPLPPPPPPIPTHLVVDAVVCVAADALGAAPTTVRAALYAAFRRARELRLSVDDVEKALAPAAAAKAEKTANQGSR